MALPRPDDYLKPEQIRALYKRSNLVGALLILHAWALILGAMALFVVWPNPLTFLLAVMVIGGRQHGLTVLMHDCSHGLLFENRKLNEWTGTWLCAAPNFVSLLLYRPYHLMHHRLTQQRNDPDIDLANRHLAPGSKPFPITRKSFWHEVVRDLTGQSAFVRWRALIKYRAGAEKIAALIRSGAPAPMSRLAPTRRPIEILGMGLLREGVTANAILWAAMAVAGYWWVYPVLWLLPLATWYQLTIRIRTIAEHMMVPDNNDLLRNARTTYANPIERLLIVPYWINYHLDHHLLTGVPCWRLPAANRAMLAAGFGPRMELKQGYRSVLAVAASST